MSDKSLRKAVKVFRRNGYCCPMDSGPLKSWGKRNKKNKVMRKLLKRFNIKEANEY